VGLSRPQRVRRAGQTSAAIAKIYLGYKVLALLERRGLDRFMRNARRRWDAASARTLHDAAVRLGGLLLKAGQFLGSRPDVVPAAYVRRLSRLQDRVPPHPYPVVRELIEAELGSPPAALFARLWRRPIASASLAQVHRARLRDGRDVAVKVQRPEVAATVEADLRSLRVAVAALERLEGPLGLAPLLDELEEVVPRELDFAREAEAAERMRRNFEDDPGILIPAVIPGLTSRRVLVTEYVRGIKITDRRRLDRAGIDRTALVERLVEAYATQILKHGYFHADPHPGNLLAVPTDGKPALAFVDFGLVEELPPEFRLALVGLAGPLLAGDAEGTGRALEGLGVMTRNGDPRAPAAAGALLVEFVRRKRTQPGRARSRDLVEQLSELARENPDLEIPTHLWLITRVLGLIWGTAAALGVPVDLFGAMASGDR
jgi:predicted unusual protein kinase regulating ubiquinone biosynthesis (AarF/ABC1/UbiB family)